MKKTVLITGATGYLGAVVTRDLINSRKYNINILLEDINDYESIEAYLSGQKVDVVVHMAALVPSRKNTDKKVLQTNYYATKNLAALCKECHFIFLSSECVFRSDTPLERYINDAKEPETLYGKSKAAAEDYLLNQSGINKLSIIRTSMLYGYDAPKRKNFLRFLFDNVEESQKVEVFTDVYNRPTHVKDLSNFILTTIEESITGTIHAVSEDYVSRYKLSEMFCDAYGYSKDLLIPANQPLAWKKPKQLNLKPSEIFTRQIKFPLNVGIKSCLQKLEN